MHKPAIPDAEEAVQKLRRAAFDEGMLQGRKAGYEQGFQEGVQRARGEARQQVEQQAQELARSQSREALAVAEEQWREKTGQLHKNLERQRDHLERVAQQLREASDRLVAESEDDMLALAFEALCRVLGDAAADLPGLRSQLQACLKQWHGREGLAVHLHPQDLALLQAVPGAPGQPSQASPNGNAPSLRWVGDDRVTLGGFLLQSSEGELDARLEVQLASLKECLLRTRDARRVTQAHAQHGRSAE